MDKTQFIVSIITITISAISLIVTIVSWTITAKRQKELLEHQIEAEREKTLLQNAADRERNKLEFSRLRNMERIDILRKWVLEGKAICKEALQDQPEESERKETIRKITEWKDNFGLNMWQTVYLLERFNPTKPYELLALCVQYSESLPNATILETRRHLFDELTNSATSSLVHDCEKLETQILGKLAELENSILEI